MQAIAALRRKVARIEACAPGAAPVLVPLGHAGVDAELGGGLLRGRLHEIFADEPRDAASAAGFAAMLACRIAPRGGPVVWLRETWTEGCSGGVHAPGLAGLGMDPARLVLGAIGDATALLRVAAEMARCREVAVLVIEVWRMPRVLDLTATRRLAVAAEASGVTALMLRVDAQPMPSAAWTRWSVRAAPSLSVGANAPGLPALSIQVLRQRGGSEGRRWQMEWDRDESVFREVPPIGPALSGAVVPLPGRRQAAAGRRAVG